MTPTKTKYKYIEFHAEAQQGVAYWSIWNHKYKQLIGRVEFHKRWKEWEFVPEYGTGFTIECLEDIIHFIKQLKDN